MAEVPDAEEAAAVAVVDRVTDWVAEVAEGVSAAWVPADSASARNAVRKPLTLPDSPAIGLHARVAERQ